MFSQNPSHTLADLADSAATRSERAPNVDSGWSVPTLFPVATAPNAVALTQNAEQNDHTPSLRRR